jgi:biotin synthase
MLARGVIGDRLGLTAQAFMAGANAIFTGEKMLTTPCSGWDEDKSMLGRWGLRGLRSFEDNESVEVDQGSLAKEQPATQQAASA